MSQNITLKIAGKEYPILAPTPEMEARMRTAAEEINAMFSKYDSRYPDKTLADKLVFVTLNEAVGKLAAQEGGRNLASEAKALEAELGNYLEAIEKNR